MQDVNLTQYSFNSDSKVINLILMLLIDFIDDSVERSEEKTYTTISQMPC